jgi:hypothetical protein
MAEDFIQMDDKIYFCHFAGHNYKTGVVLNNWIVNAY